MKKTLAILLVALIGTQSITQATITETLNSYGKKAATKTAQIAIDVAAAYCLCMGITLMHELGHAVVAKIAYGSPIDITLGTTEATNDKIFAQICGIKIKGFNPLGGISLFPKDLTPAYKMQHPLKEATMTVAGPLSGAISSYTALKLIQKYCPNFIFSKAAAYMGLFNDTLFQLLFLDGEYYKTLLCIAVHLISQTESGKQAINTMIQNKK